MDFLKFYVTFFCIYKNRYKKNLYVIFLLILVVIFVCVLLILRTFIFVTFDFRRVRTRTKRSFVWRFFTQSSDGKEATCRTCGVIVAFRNTSNLKDHVERNHWPKWNKLNNNSSLSSIEDIDSSSKE